MRNRGFSLTEFLVAIGIALVVAIVITAFARNTFFLNYSAQASLNAQLESRKLLALMVSELRSASVSALGGYALESAGTSTITFYADVTGDNNADRVRYYIDPATKSVKRGLVVASGTPPSYSIPSETLSILISDIANGTSTALFDYYNGNYAGTSSPLSYPLNLN